MQTYTWLHVSEAHDKAVNSAPLERAAIRREGRAAAGVVTGCRSKCMQGGPAASRAPRHWFISACPCRQNEGVPHGMKAFRMANLTASNQLPPEHCWVTKHACMERWLACCPVHALLDTRSSHPRPAQVVPGTPNPSTVSW